MEDKTYDITLRIQPSPLLESSTDPLDIQFIALPHPLMLQLFQLAQKIKAQQHLKTLAKLTKNAEECEKYSRDKKI